MYYTDANQGDQNEREHEILYYNIIIYNHVIKHNNIVIKHNNIVIKHNNIVIEYDIIYYIYNIILYRCRSRRSTIKRARNIIL